MACRATSLKARFWALSFIAAAMTTQCLTRSGYSRDQRMACMPPRLPPITAAQQSIPRWSASRAWLFTQSRARRGGKSGPQGLPVSGLMELGPVEPWQPPILLRLTTKKRLVSMGLPGPMHSSHQPGFLSSSLW